MARTIQQIYDEIITEKETFASLNGLLPDGTRYDNLLSELSSASQVASWRLFVYIVAVGHWVLETFFDAFVVDVKEIAARAIPGTLRWYAERAKEFQLGDTLEVIEDKATYAVIDETKQIVTNASATENSGLVFIKVAKTVTNVLVALDAGELTQFDAYMHDIKFAGVFLNISSLNADALLAIMEVVYDPILDPLIVQANVIAAINTYISNLPFDANLKRIALVDQIQEVEGIIDVIIASLQGKQGLTIYEIDREYTPQAGYMIFDEGNSTITMTAEL